MTEEKKTMPLFLLFLFPAACYYLMEGFSFFPWEETRPIAQILNICLFTLAFAVILCVTGWGVWAVAGLSAFTAFVGLWESYALRFRDSPIVPWDLSSMGTALSVANSYPLAPDRRQALALLLLLLLTALFLLLALRTRKLPVQPRILGTIWGAGLLWLLTLTLWNDAWVSRWKLYPFLYTPKIMAERNGFVVTYLMDLQYMTVEKPAGYSRKKVKEVLSSQETGEETRRPDIVVVMDEAFSDLTVLSDFAVTEDPIPFVHRCREEGKAGWLHVSVKGGNTANTEFEFLTGNTMDFLPPGSIAYLQYVRGEVLSIPSYLKERGYRTTAVHPYRPGGWERDRVWPLLGFDRCLFQEDFADPVLIRDYISDESVFRKAEEVLSEEGDQFLFCVTMQNHSSYSEAYENLPENVHAEDRDSRDLDRYLSLLQRTDQALEDFCQWAAKREEPTVVLFFGDHQPNDSLVSPVLGGKGPNDTDRYIVPYVCYANFPVGKLPEETSANYLGAYLLSAVGLSLPPYQAFLLELSSSCPVVTAREVRGGDREDLDTYRKVQYYALFDQK